MRQKFGSSSGLSSKGRMGGIGSDPNYKSGGISNIDASEVIAIVIAIVIEVIVLIVVIVISIFTIILAVILQ